MVKMKDIFNSTEKWLVKHGVSLGSMDSLTLFQKNKLYTKKLILPFSPGLSGLSLIKRLPDAPKWTTKASERKRKNMKGINGEVIN